MLFHVQAVNSVQILVIQLAEATAPQQNAKVIVWVPVKVLCGDHFLQSVYELYHFDRVRIILKIYMFTC